MNLNVQLGIFQMLRIFRRRDVVRILRRNHSTLEGKKSRQIFSAIQPTGEAHLGNYLGALKKWVDLQNSEENAVIYGIADLHSITLPRDPKELQRNILIMAATILACGIDTDKSILFQQSDVKQHTELCWILGTLSTMPKLSHLPQFKEKSASVKEAPVGIFLYPVLQVADIMLYRTTHVPVGEDQIQQIQFGQHLIQFFNSRFKSNFPMPEPLIDSSFGRIKSLGDPTKKMSKSDLKHTSCINLTDEPDLILKKVKKAVTDSQSKVTYEPNNRPGVSNLISIHSGLTGQTPQEIVEESTHLNTGKYKEVLADIIIEKLTPIRMKIIEYLNSKEYILRELDKGAEKARERAEDTMKKVRERIGIDLVKEHVGVRENKKEAVV